LTAPEVGPPVHDRRLAAAVNRLDVATTLMSTKLMGAEPPGPVSVRHGANGFATYRMIPKPVGV
jgi:hypothetical protein